MLCLCRASTLVSLSLPCCAVDIPNKFEGSGKTGMSVKSDDFGLTYLVKDENSIGNVTYSKKLETWFFAAKR